MDDSTLYCPNSIALSPYKDRPVQSLVTDAKFVHRLMKKLRERFVIRNHGTVALSPLLYRLERRTTDENFSVDVWTFKSHFAVAEFDDREMEVLFALMDSDGDGIVDLAEGMLYIRKQLGCETMQFHDIVKRARAKRPQIDRSPFAAYGDVAAKAGKKKAPLQDAHITRAALFKYLTSPECGMTQGEALFVMEHCVVPMEENEEPASVSDSSRAKLDIEYLYHTLFAFPLPQDIVYPILIGKLAEPLACPESQRTGIVGLLSCCGISATQQIDSAPALDPSTFRKLVFDVGSGLAASEADLLHSFLLDADSGLVPVAALLPHVLGRIPPPPPHALDVTVEIARRCVTSTPPGLCALHLCLARFSDKTAPILEYTAALRSCGCRIDMCPDIFVEYLHTVAPTCVGVVSMLRGALPKCRESLIEQVFIKLDENSDGLIPHSAAVEGFQADPESKLEQLWAHEMAAFVGTLSEGDSQISLSEFSYHWANVSASILEDSVFQLLMWKAYDMQRGTKGPSVSRRRQCVRGDSAPVSRRRQRECTSGTPTPVRTTRAFLHE